MKCPEVIERWVGGCSYTPAHYHSPMTPEETLELARDNVKRYTLLAWTQRENRNEPAWYA